MSRFSSVTILLIAILGVTAGLVVPAGAWAAPICGPLDNGRVADVFYEGTAVFWAPVVQYEYDRMTLTISGPCETIVKTFKPGEQIFFDLGEIQRVVDGRYQWQLRATPTIDPAVQEALQASRGSGEEDAIWWNFWQKGSIPGGPSVDGAAFTVERGLIIDPGFGEESQKRATLAGKSAGAPLATAATVAGFDGDGAEAAASGGNSLSAKDFVIIDDLIVDGSACIGFDCVNGESFGFDTIRLKENNLRIKFDDTSTAASFPRNDWQITINDSANGGASKFSIDDISGSRTPFTIEANARSHSLYIDDGGRLGLRTSTPSTEIHTVDGDTPTLRLQQDGSSGFAPQTWDVAGNETNFFVRDVTNGSALPFRIFPDSPSSSLVIKNGDVGLGTASPSEKLHLSKSGDVAFALEDTSAGGERWLFKNNTANGAFVVTADASGGNAPFKVFPGIDQDTFVVGTPGGAEVIGINRSPGTISHPLHVGTNSTNGNGAHVTAGGVWTNGSSRASKKGITPLSESDAHDALVSLAPVRFQYKGEPGEEYVGFIAEDVPELVAQGDRKTLSAMDIVAVLTKVVQEQDQMINDLRTRLEKMEQEAVKP